MFNPDDFLEFLYVTGELDKEYNEIYMDDLKEKDNIKEMKEN